MTPTDRSSDPLEKALVNFVKGQNNEKGFVEKVIRQIGYPRWNKAITIQKASQPGLETIDTTITYIPFVRDSQNYVNASLLISTVPGDTMMGYVCDWQYATKENATDSATINSAEGIALFMMMMDVNVFNHRDFMLTDSLLFKGLSQNGNLPTSGNNVSRKIHLDVNFNNNGGNLSESVTISLVPIINWTMWYNYIIDTYGSVAFYLSLPESGGGSGGGSGPGSGLPPGCNEGPVAPGTVFTDVDFICGPGWVPVPIPPETGGGIWTSYPISGVQHFQTTQITTQDQNIITNWENNKIDDSQLDSCRKIILNKLKQGNNEIGRMLTKMDRAMTGSNNLEKFEVQVSGVTNLSSNVMAQTTGYNFNPQTGVFSCQIELNQNALATATDLVVAQALIHEFIHAYMRSIVYRVNNNPLSNGWIFQMTNPQMFDAFADSLYNHNMGQVVTLPPNLPASDTQRFHHNYMANFLLNNMASALKDYDNNRIGLLVGSDQYYWLQAWQGLQNTDIWNHFWPTYNHQNPELSPQPTRPPAAMSETDKQNLSYALTPNRLVHIFNSIVSERNGDQFSVGKKPIPGGCY